MKSIVSSPKGFVLVFALIILVMVSIFVVAFASSMRIERKASQNFTDRAESEALAAAALNRIIASHAAIADPFTVDPQTGLPTAMTRTVYWGNSPLPGIYSLIPTPGVSTANGLIQLSRGTSGAPRPARTPADWAYGGLSDVPNLLPQDSNGSATVPDWIPIRDPENRLVGEIAYTIWDESGKFDVNMIGPDPSINGLAPFAWDYSHLLTSDPSPLIQTLNGENGLRDRSNFSLVDIRTGAGDDRAFFTIPDLVRSGRIQSEASTFASASSRDFELRPEWNGKRLDARDYQKSYVNDSRVFDLFVQNITTAAVSDSLDLTQLTGYSPDIMRLLAVLRRSFPNPAGTYSKSALSTSVPDVVLPRNGWYDNDILGIGLNLIQATHPLRTSTSTSLHPARDLYVTAQPQHDPHRRTGIRMMPYVTETTVRVERTAIDRVTVKEYIEVWNPHARPIANYRLYHDIEAEWPAGRTTPGDNPSTSGVIAARAKGRLITDGGVNLQPGQFHVFTYERRDQPLALNRDFRMATRTRISGKNGEVPYLTQNGFDGPPSSPRLKYALEYFIPAADLAAVGSVAWYSLQIDDPRMGQMTRPSATDLVADASSNPYSYSWKRFPGSHSLAGLTDGPKVVSPLGDGFNQNFGDGFPRAWKNATLAEQRAKAFASFAFPGRPFLNLGELSCVFTNRPWTNLHFGASPLPSDALESGAEAIPQATDAEHFTTQIFNYYTTIGTSTATYGLAWDDPSRQQDENWLFEPVSGRVRPIRGRVNLNTASREVLRSLIGAEYRILQFTESGKTADAHGTIPARLKPEDVDALVEDVISIRPLRSLADLGRLPSLPRLHAEPSYVSALVDAAVARLAAFGTVRQQCYTIQIAARSFHPKRTDLIISESRLTAQVYLDSYSRQAFIQSLIPQ